MFPHSYRNTSGSLGEQKIEVGTHVFLWYILQVSPNFHKCFYNVWETQVKMLSIYFIK